MSIGQLISNRFELHDLLGRGGMGEVIAQLERWIRSSSGKRVDGVKLKLKVANLTCNFCF